MPKICITYCEGFSDLRNSFWTEERVKELIRLIKSCVSSVEAAKRLKTTRSAVIGKARRLNMVFCSNGNLEQELEERPVSVNLNNIFPLKGCLWIEGNPKPLREGMFCCAPVAAEGASWCIEHIKRVYIKKAAA